MVIYICTRCLSLAVQYFVQYFEGHTEADVFMVQPANILQIFCLLCRPLHNSLPTRILCHFAMFILMLFTWIHLCRHSSVPIAPIFGLHTSAGSRLGAGTGTGTVLCRSETTHIGLITLKVSLFLP